MSKSADFKLKIEDSKLKILKILKIENRNCAWDEFRASNFEFRPSNSSFQFRLSTFRVRLQSQIPPRFQAREKLPVFSRSNLDRGFNAQKEPVASGQREPRHVKDG